MRRNLMLAMLLVVLLAGTATADSLDPPAPIGVVFMQVTFGPTPVWRDHGEPPRPSPSLERLARGLQAAALSGDGVVPRQLAFEVRVFGTTPRFDVLDGFDIGPLSPVGFGPPTHVEWLTNLTPSAFRSTAPFRPLREGRSLGW